MRSRWPTFAIIVLLALTCAQTRAEIPRPRRGVALAKLRQLLSRSPSAQRSIKAPGPRRRLTRSNALASAGKTIKTGIRAAGLG